MPSSGVGQIERIMVVDDDPDVRDAYAVSVGVADRTPVEELGPLGALDEYIQREPPADAAVSDHRLTPTGYASFDGAELVAAWYRRRFPAILCTTFGKSNVDQFRSLRRWLPIVMLPEELTPDSLIEGLEYVQREFTGQFIAPRRPWRALVHFVDYEDANRMVYAKLPGWSSEAVALRLVDLPAALATQVTTVPDYRCYAIANLGAESNEELYVSEWELR